MGAPIDLPLTDTLEQFDNAMQFLAEKCISYSRLAEKTDRDDILCHIHFKCRETIDLLNEGIEISREDDSIDLYRYARLIWARCCYLDLLHYCIEKNESC